jgi:hypothetical protein
MNDQLPPLDPIKAYQREATAARRVGEDAKCETCGETRTGALNSTQRPLKCEECQRKTEGRTTMDAHHIAGKANSPITTSIPANDHRAELTVAQHNWPRETLENPDGDPLLRCAASIRGFMDTLRYFMKVFLLPAAELLECLSAILKAMLGRKWWLKTELKRFTKKEDSHEE